MLATVQLLFGLFTFLLLFFLNMADQRLYLELLKTYSYNLNYADIWFTSHVFMVEGNQNLH